MSYTCVLTDESVDTIPLTLLHVKTLDVASEPPIHIDICGISFLSISPSLGLPKLDLHVTVAVRPTEIVMYGSAGNKHWWIQVLVTLYFKHWWIQVLVTLYFKHWWIQVLVTLYFKEWWIHVLVTLYFKR